MKRFYFPDIVDNRPHIARTCFIASMCGNVNAKAISCRGAGMIKQILDDLANSVVEHSPYRRTVVAFYARPIAPAPDSTTHVIDYAARGLTPDEERTIRLFIAGGGVVRGEKYNPVFRVSNSYYLPAGSIPYSITPRIPSRRRFINPHGWHAADLLLIPCLTNDHIIGQISVDDPRDGAKPTSADLRELERLAAVAAVALTQAHQRETLSQRHRLFSFLTENAMTGVLIVQAGRIRYANDRAVALFGYSSDELQVLEPWWQLFYPDDRSALQVAGEHLTPGEFEARGIRRDGAIVWLKLQALAMEYERKPALLLNLLDVTDRVKAELLLKEKAFRDPLTGLFNRHYFDETIQRELKRSQRYKRPFTLMMTDLTGFKRVNDRLGHQAGDRILHDVAQIIKEQIRESDWVIRYGGDEFLVILPETGVQVDALAQRLRRVIAEWAAARIPEVGLGIDVGWATWTPDNNLSLSRLIQLADSNMYAEKEAR